MSISAFLTLSNENKNHDNNAVEANGTDSKGHSYKADKNSEVSLSERLRDKSLKIVADLHKTNLSERSVKPTPIVSISDDSTEWTTVDL